MNNYAFHRGLLGIIGFTKRRCSTWKRIAMVVAFAVMMLGVARSARAQVPVCSEGCAAVLIGGLIVEGGVLTGGLVTGIGSAVHAARGETKRGWFVSSYVFGGLNLAATVLWSSLAAGNADMKGTWSAFAAAHASITALDVIAPSVGFARGAQPDVALVVVGGGDVAGRRWNGLGVQVSNF